METIAISKFGGIKYVRKHNSKETSRKKNNT